MKIPTLATILMLAALTSCGGGSGSTDQSQLSDPAVPPAASTPPAKGSGDNDSTPDSGAEDASPPDADEQPEQTAPAPQQPPIAETPEANEPASPDYAPFSYSDDSFSITLVVEAGASPGGTGSQTQPFNTIGAALDNAQPGTKILIGAGSYPAMGWHDNLRGSETQPILILANGSVIVDAAGIGVGGQFVQPQFLIVDGLTIQNTARHGLNIDDGSNAAMPANNLILKNLHFRQIGNGTNNDCLKISGIRNSLITANEFEGCNKGEGIDFVGGHDTVVFENYFHDVAGTGLQIKGGSSGILAKSNRFIDVPGRSINAGGNTDNHLFRPVSATAEATNIQIETNIFLRSGNTPVAFTGCVDCRFVNNTIIDPRAYLAAVLYENTTKAESSGNLFANNLILFNHANLRSFFVNVASNTTARTFDMQNNLLFALDDPSFSTIPLPSEIPTPQNNLVQRPHGLVDWVGGDYRLGNASDAIGAGMDNADLPTHGYAGSAFAEPISIGAFAAP